ncbi:mandelate racemase/muconate lactonizing enzyme family protein [Aquella oligotrophica]|uniref:Mandelate racemase/muconate lactonizing enzyme family protein n=1 Tax=Aquella oligotrophica TaxID=2067065 RepID=A0A2I7N3N7_9NEIS|nr:mandelate racemase/muconate lactonizing enzyme family protein [Aquella oligotrophica]AUR50845.1 mandelate racemase/muconate lactonizing enzyme family protein [Aquella oligotrophica]
MKITRVEIFDMECPKRPQWHPVFVRIHTDEGISGVGEAGLAYDWGHSAAANMINEIVKARVIGFDPFQTELLWSKMFREGFWAQGSNAVFYAAMSAIDTALWDIKGKALGVPVYQLLGGKVNPKLRTYASQLQFDWDPEAKKLIQPEEYAKAAQKALDEGYDAVKVNPMFYDKDGNTLYDLTKLFKADLLELVKARMQAIRDTVGAKVDIFLECHSLLGATSAIQIGKEIAEEFNCAFMEEPVNYVNSALHDKVAAKLTVPLAAGERIYLRHGMRPYFENQTIDILQPDIGLCGGFTEAKKICDYADMYDIQVQAHVCGGPVATAASLHLETAIPNFYIHEHHTYATKEWNRELCIQDYQPQNGYMTVPELPGLGIELNDTIVMKSKAFEVK